MISQDKDEAIERKLEIKLVEEVENYYRIDPAKVEEIELKEIKLN